jgi:hypothetical protein
MTNLSGRLTESWSMARPMPGVRPGGRPTFLCGQESRQRNRPCKTAPSGFPAMLEAQGRAELTSLRSVQSGGAKSVLEARCARALGFCASRRFRRGTRRTAEQPTAKPGSSAPRGIWLAPFSTAEERKVLKPCAQRTSRTDSAQLSERSVAKRVLRGASRPEYRREPEAKRRAVRSGVVSLPTFLSTQESRSPAGANSPHGACQQTSAPK